MCLIIQSFSLTSSLFYSNVLEEAIAPLIVRALSPD